MQAIAGKNKIVFTEPIPNEVRPFHSSMNRILKSQSAIASLVLSEFLDGGAAATEHGFCSTLVSIAQPLSITDIEADGLIR